MAINILAVITTMAFSLVVFANSLDINVQPQFVQPNDNNVVFTCSGGNKTTRMTKTMLAMRLMKLEDDDGQWTEVAALNSDGTINMSDGNATAVGRLDDAPDSYLAVTWPVAPDDVNGMYRCEGVKLTKTWKVLTEHSRHLAVESAPTDQSPLLEELKKYEKELVDRVNETIYSAMKLSRTNLISLLDSEFREFKENLDKNTAVSSSRPKVNVEIISWPEGNFTLLMPDAGCPKHPPGWVKSFLKFKAVPGDKYYPIDTPLHLARPHKKDGFIYRQYCTLPASTERNEPWPAGSYCLCEADMRDECPRGFKRVYAKVKIPNDKGNVYLYYFPNNRQTGGFFNTFYNEFCCRHDGNATTPIELPVSHPFYLVRYGGRCQEVKGMDVTQDVFMMETVDSVLYDKWFDSNDDYHPDVTFKPYKEELCYYTKTSL